MNETVGKIEVYEPRGAALELFNTRALRVLMEGPAGTGKTLACLFKLWILANMYPGSRHLIVRDTRVSMTTSVLVTFETFVIGLTHPLVTSGPERAHRSNYLLDNGSEIVVGGLDTPERTFSAEYDTIWVFEAFECAKDQVDKLLRVLRWPAMPYKQLVCDTNPNDEGHWLNQEAMKGNYLRLCSKHEDNPRYWDAEKNDWTEEGRKYVLGVLDKYTGPLRERLRFGRWVGAEGAIYARWDRRKHVAAPDPSKRWPRQFIGVDPGWTHPCAITRVLVDADDRHHVSRHLLRSGMVEAEVILAIKAFGESEVVVIDSEDPGFIESARRADLPAVAAKKGPGSVVAGIARVAQLLEPRSDGEPGLTVHPSCTDLITAMEGYAWDPKSSRDKPLHHLSDGPDSLRYVCTYTQSPPPVAFELAGLDKAQQLSRLVSGTCGAFVPAMPEGLELDRAIAEKRSGFVAFQPDSQGSAVLWRPLINGGPTRETSYAMFAACSDQHSPSVVVVSDVATGEVVLEWRKVTTPERFARLVAILAPWFRGWDGEPATLGILLNTPGRILETRLDQLDCGAAVRWDPTRDDLADWLGLLGAAWESGQLRESEPAAIAEARQYVYVAGAIMHSSIADNTARRASYADRVLCRAGLWQVMQGCEPPPEHSLMPHPLSYAGMKARGTLPK